jgi:hypothetical protein
MKNSDSAPATQTDAETGSGAGFAETRESSAETHTDLPSVSGQVVPLAADGTNPERELDHCGPDRARGSAVESADNLPNQALESPRSQTFALAGFFGRPRLLRDEDLDAYKSWEEAVHAALQPRDLFEAIWARDFTHFTWEIERGRRIRNALLDGATPEALRAMVKARIDDGWVDQRAHDAKAAELALQVWKGDISLGLFDLREDEITAQAYRQLHAVIDSLERQIAGWESRRNKLLRDLETRREKLELQVRFKELMEQAGKMVDAHSAAKTDREPLARRVLSVESRAARLPTGVDSSRCTVERSRSKPDSIGPRSSG